MWLAAASQSQVTQLKETAVTVVARDHGRGWVPGREPGSVDFELNAKDLKKPALLALRPLPTARPGHSREDGRSSNAGV